MDLNQLRQAGFGDDEINTYSSSHPEISAPKSMAVPVERPDRSTSLRQAGFSDQEINDWSTTQSRGLTPQGVSREAVPTSKPSFLEAAKTGLKSGLAGAMKMYEIPSRQILEATGLVAPGTFASELLQPSEAEQKNIRELGIPGEVVSGVAGLPGAFAKYGPLMAVAPAGILGTAATFAGEKAAEELSTGKIPTPLELGEEAAMGGIFGAIGPLGRLAKAAILGGAFGTQGFIETYAQTKDLEQAFRAAIAPTIIGAGLGVTGGKKKGEPVKPTEQIEPTKPIKTKAEYEQWRDEQLKTISKQVPDLAPEEITTISNVMDYVMPWNEPRRGPIEFGFRGPEALPVEGKFPYTGEMGRVFGGPTEKVPKTKIVKPEIQGQGLPEMAKVPIQETPPPAPGPELFLPAPSPTAKDQFVLPGIKQGLEMKGAKEGVTPTLEGTPLAEAARKAEAEKVQPKLFDVKKQEEKGDILFWIRSKGGINPDTVSADVKELTQKESGFKGKSSLVRKGGRGLDELAQEWGWEKGGEISTDELADAIKEAVQSKRKGVPRKPGVGSTEQEIDRYIRRQEEDRYRNQIYEEDPNLLKNETFENLTKSFDDEIMGFKEELRDEGYSETDITRAIEQAQKDIKTESRSPDLERIKKELAPEPTGKTPAELVVQQEKAQPAPPLSKETKAKYLPAVRADGEVIIGSGTHGSIPPERYSEAQKVEIGFVEPKTGDFLTEAQVRTKELSLEKPISPIGEKVPDVISRLSEEEHTGLTNLGYSDPEINKMGFDSARASFWNEIKNEKAALPGVETVTAPPAEDVTRPVYKSREEATNAITEKGLNPDDYFVAIVPDKINQWRIKPRETVTAPPTEAKPVEIPIKESAKLTALNQKIAEQEKKIEALKPAEVKPTTLREFIESKGEKWPMKATNPDYQNLKTEWNEVQKGGFSPEERGSFSTKPIPPPIKLAPEEQKVENMISRETRDKVSFTDRVKDIANLTYNNYVNQWHLLGKTVEEMAGGKPSARGEGALASIRLATFKAYGMATTFLEKGIPIKEQREGKLKGDLKFESESLTSIFSDISKDPQKLHAWERYAVSLRAIEKEGQGFHTGIDPKDAKFIVDKYDKQFRPLFDRAKKFQDSLFDYYAEDMLTPELRDKIKAANMLYVPFYRAVEGTQGGLGKNLQASQALRRMKGYKEGEIAAPIVDPIESMVKNTYLLVSNAEKNSALLQFVRFAKKSPQGIDFVREVKPGDEGYPVQSHTISLAEIKRNTLFKQVVEEAGVTNQTLKDEMVNIFRPFTPHGKEDMITVYEGGKRKFFEVDPTIGRALQGLDKDSVNQIVKILSYPTKMLRAGAVLAPEFMVRNPVRDWFSAMVYAKHGFNPYNFFEGLIEGVGKTDLYYKWIMSGGSQASFVSLDRTDLRKTATELLAKKRAAGLLTGNDYKEVVGNLVRNPIEALRIVSELGEMGTRLGVFERALGKEPEGARGSQRAALASREATIDFGRIGAKSKAVNQIIAFWNANVQGLDKLVRELDFRTPSGRENAMRVATRAVMTITLPSLLLAWANRNDERVQNLPEWQKTMFWIIPTENHIFRIPKPFELGIIFGTVPEKIMGYLQTNDPETFNKIGTAIATGSMPGMIPTAALPFVENWANKSTFTGRPIVPRGKENLLPEYQYQPYTTETAKKIGGLISHLPLIGDTGMASPSKVENFIRGWSGGLGNLALKAADKGLEEAGIKSDEIKPSKTWADIPGLRAFVVRYPGADAQSVQDFYDKAEEASQVHATITRLTKEGNLEEASRLIERYPYLSRIYTTLNKTKGTMTKMHQLIDKVYANPSMDPDEKRNLIDEIYLRMIAISRQQMDVIKEGE